MNFSEIIMSFARVRELVETRGFVIHRYFTVEGVYRYLTIVSARDSSEFLLDLGTKYRFESEGHRREVKLTLQTVNEEGYYDLKKDEQLQKIYKEIESKPRLPESESEILKGYDQPISLSEEKIGNEILKRLYRQVKRMQLCVRTLPYKLALLEETSFVILTEEGIQTYTTDGYASSLRLYVTVPLSLLFERQRYNDHSQSGEPLEEDMNKILDQLYRILNHNQKQQSQKIQEMINQRRDVFERSNKVLQQKERYQAQIVESQELLCSVTTKELNLVREFESLQQGSSNFSQDLDLSQKRFHLRDEMEKLQKAKKELIASISELRERLHTLSLKVDNILFDNMVMLVRIFDNFQQLDQLTTN